MVQGELYSGLFNALTITSHRPELAYVYANEALLRHLAELTPAHQELLSLLSNALYTLVPVKRLIDASDRLRASANACMSTEKSYARAIRLLSAAQRIRCTPGVLLLRCHCHSMSQRFVVLVTVASELK